MSSILKIIFVLILTGNILVNTSDIPDKNISKNNILDINAKDISDEVLDKLLSFFMNILHLNDLIADLTRELLKEKDGTYLPFLPHFADLIMTNKEIFEELVRDSPSSIENFPKLSWHLNTDYFKEISLEIKKYNRISKKKVLLNYILNEILLLIKTTHVDFLEIELYFKSIDPYSENIKSLLKCLSDETNNKITALNINKSKNPSVEVSAKSEESQDMANILAHQLIGCCQDGKCGSLNEKKSQDKKNKNKNKREKRKKKKEKEENKAEENEVEESDGEDGQKEPQGAVGGRNNQVTEEILDKTNHVITFSKLALEDKYSSNIITKSNLNSDSTSSIYKKKLSDKLFKNSLDILTQMIENLYKILRLEQNLVESVTKIRSLVEILSLEKQRNYKSSLKKKFDVLKSKKIINYLRMNYKNPNFDQKKYNLSLKACSSSCIEDYSKKHNYKGCYHCKCQKCNAKLYMKNNIYSID